MSLKNYLKFASIGLLTLVASACEPKFAGDRPFNIDILNGPGRAKLVEIGSTQYLGILNTNLEFEASSGSIQFYSLSDPQKPKLETSLSVEVPSNVGDFEFDGDTLFVADRNKHRIFVYDYSSGKFSQRLDEDGGPKFVKVTDNPQRLLSFTRPGDNLKMLAIVCQSSGFIHFIRTDNLEFVEKGSDESVTPDLAVSRNIKGANLEMIERLKTVKNKDGEDEIVQQHLDISFSQRVGFGINQAVLLGVTDGDGSIPLIVTASYLAQGIFGFRLDTFQNTANIAWDLDGARSGWTKNKGTANEIKVQGSKELGFRGLARDAAGNIYASSRTDNSLYRIDRSVFEMSKERKATESTAKRNTVGFDENDVSYRIVNFDRDPTDKLFPRMGEVEVNYCPKLTPPPTNCSTGTATVAWVLGLGQKDGSTVEVPARIYRVDLTQDLTDEDAVTFTKSADDALEDSPQRLLWNPEGSVLYVLNVKSNSISVLNDTSLDLIATVQP